MVKLTLAQRIAVTVAVLAALIGLSLLNLEPQRARSLFEERQVLPNLSWLGFGVGPLLSGYFVVEVIALVVPHLRWRRVSGAGPRRPLVLASWGVGLALAALQSTTVGRATTGGLLLASAMMAGTLLCWGLAVVANRFGVMNGFAVAALGSIDGFASIQRLWGMVQTDEVSPGVVLVAVALVGAAAYAIVWLTRRPAAQPALPVRAAPPVSGLGMTASVALLLSFPMTLANFVPAFGPISQSILTSQVLYVSLWLGISVAFTLFWSLLFFRPRAVASMWKRWNPEVDEVSAVLAARAAMPGALRDAFVLNVAFALAMQLTLPAAGSLVGTAMVTALMALDALDELRFRQAHGPIVSVYELARVPEVDAVLHRLSSRGIEAFARTRHYRAAFQFFGPHLPIEVMVPASRAEEARAVLAE